MTKQFKILIVDDEAEQREAIKIILESKGFMVGEASSGGEALDLLEGEFYPLVLCDYIMPGINGLEVLKRIKQLYGESIEVIIFTGYGDVESAVEAMKLGAFGYFIKGNNPDELLLEIEKAKKLLSLGKKHSLIAKKNEKRYLYRTKNQKMKEILSILEDVANTNANVLLLGESGVGKEVIAQKIHDMSDRAKMPFVAINCQYFSSNLLESELFGHEKGAFTGANEKRIGRFEEANGGTVFLDEIGEISNEIQVKFLRVLENRTIERLGSNKQIPVDFRLICATNRDLIKEVKNYNFREDLFYRINTITIEIPPLRKRREDIEDMIYFFMDMYKEELKKDIKEVDNNTLKFLLNYDYPGNIRELKNMIERLVVLSKNGILKMDNLGAISFPVKESNRSQKVAPYEKAKEEFEKEYFYSALKQHDFNVTKTADAIGISRRQLINKINEYNLRQEMDH
ncbi:sigma-54-dependent transcriptional regulator [Lutispora thermophila]|uniref:Stage 0 sporulation protein A homolog n=1 Tax=Lutispora thermophila DSM 19022 TaxID=1122184 RepID=A0A1M6FDQ0_9FIRM|nr:sigma-54 dependent transcriptional regulator [Lutispora thermophila]SHI95759.1 DNA-binding transcriptional response regulator, NtrC family, contains REC, AAA-type ATPase, and a Fis-type DNA-binding domains [Lutispora thermophila DSM 19022]